jgi:large subunit ribosomal protein L34
MKRTYQPSKLRRQRRFGYLKKKRTKAGRNILKARRRVGRRRLTQV